MMRLLDLMVFLGVRGSWARSRLAYRLLWNIVVADRARRSSAGARSKTARAASDRADP